MDNETKTVLGIIGGVVAAVLLAIFVLVGPKGCSRHLSAWEARAYGSDWLVVQYAMDGSVIARWTLRNKSIGNEQQSDGIYFLDDNENVVHLSGHYIYVQVKAWDDEDFTHMQEKLIPKSSQAKGKRQ